MGAKQIHDKYGKKILEMAMGERYCQKPQAIHFGQNAGKFVIDGTIDNSIAVEIESRANKQARGAVLDLLCHPYAMKLMVIIDKYGNDYTENQCNTILNKFCKQDAYKVIKLKGNGNSENIEEDVKIIKNAVTEIFNSYYEFN